MSIVPSFHSLLLTFDIKVDPNDGHYQTIQKIYELTSHTTQTAEQLGWEHPNCLHLLNDLVDLYILAHCSSHAEKLCVRLQLAMQRTYPPRDKIHAQINIKLGTALNNQMQYKRAEALFRQAIALYDDLKIERLDLERASALSGLGTSLYEQRVYSEAEVTLKHLVQIYTLAHGEGHTNTLDSINCLAIALEANGKVDEAIDLCASSLQLCIRTLGERDHITQTAVSSLARLKTSTKQYQEAEEMYHQAILYSTASLGPAHLQTLSLQEFLARVYLFRQKLVEAEEVYTYLLKQYREVQGRESIEASNMLQALG